MNIPKLTHLQFIVLTSLVDQSESGQGIRDILLQCYDILPSGSAFYQLMARMEANKMVEGWYTHKLVDKQVIKERWYKATNLGLNTRRQSVEFYTLEG